MSGVASEAHAPQNMLTLGYELSIAVIIGKKKVVRENRSIHNNGSCRI